MKKIIITAMIFAIMIALPLLALWDPDNGDKLEYNEEENKTGSAYTDGGNSSKFGSPDEAKQMVIDAVAYFNTKGAKLAFSEFNNRNGKFNARDLYIFVLDLKGNVMAHGQDENLIGTNQKYLKDADGKAFISEILEKSKKYDYGWIDYKWKSSSTGKIESKNTYYYAVNKKYVVGCGSYKYKHLQ